MPRGLKIFIFLLPLVLGFPVSGQNLKRPIILVKPSDKKAILEKIEQQPWAQSIYINFIEKLDQDINLHQLDRDKFLRGLPFDLKKGIPGKPAPFYLTYHIEKGARRNLDNATNEEWKNASTLIDYLQIGVDCGIAYYLTEEEKYAQCAVDILNAFVKSVLQSQVSDWHGRGGWLFPDDGFREVRVIGAKVPLVYDFIAEFIKEGGKPYDLWAGKKVNFPKEKTQEVFRTYADITINYGHTGSNHPVLEAPSLVYNALAMEDATEREKLLSYFLTENTENQDALNVMAKIYQKKGDIWPETSQYLNAVTSILTKLMLVVNRYQPSLLLSKKYTNILFALPKLDYLRYPNDQIIRWGDGKRYGSPSYSAYEDAYLLGQMDSNEKILTEFGPLLRRAIQEGKYQRLGIEAVLRHGVDLSADIQTFKLPRTDQVVHAGIFLQRNLSLTHKQEDALMCFVGGAHMVHGHAEGMNIELYGRGEVLGVDNGRGSYQKDIHENYSRIFAAHNTVIVNGSSQAEGGWVNLGMNKVELISMEPMPNEAAISPYHSFTQTSFVDDKGNQAEAIQERTLALIRTSPTTGYYVDVFRSKSKLPKEYHDYLYHNIGDQLTFLNKDFKLRATPERYSTSANKEWVQNKKYRHPGWHFFNDVQTSLIYDTDVKAQFTAESLEKGPVYMALHIPGFKGREYTKVLAPQTFEAPAPYHKLPTPTLVIRKKGAAWKDPFVVVFEPFSKNTNEASIISVDKLEESGTYKGLRIISKVEDQKLVQYVLTQSKDQVFQDKELGIYFKGSFAVITLDNKDKLQTVYIGEGEKLIFKKEAFIANNQTRALFLDYKKD